MQQATAQHDRLCASLGIGGLRRLLLIDLPVLRRCGLAVAVADACPELRAAAHHVTAAPGGRGAVREAIEWLLKSSGRWDELVARYLT